MPSDASNRLLSQETRSHYTGMYPLESRFECSPQAIMRLRARSILSIFLDSYHGNNTKMTQHVRSRGAAVELIDRVNSL